MEKILSIIIPSYNARKFLDKGIPTFLDPAVIDSLDVIIVNDGSTDDTAAIAEKYCRMFPDSIRLISQPNKGHGGALNTGCAAAVGKYLRATSTFASSYPKCVYTSMVVATSECPIRYCSDFGFIPALVILVQ